jgi:hypothetical protein
MSQSPSTFSLVQWATHRGITRHVFNAQLGSIELGRLAPSTAVPPPQRHISELQHTSKMRDLIARGRGQALEPMSERDPYFHRCAGRQLST